ncbi:MAG: glycosyltransferase, partial [Psychrobacter sp.]
MSTVSIIVPILNEANNLPHLFTHIAGLNPSPQQIILVDGGSNDDSFEWAQKFIADLNNSNQSAINWQVVKSQAGRARQMNKGASLATSDILLFLHADT